VHCRKPGVSWHVLEILEYDTANNTGQQISKKNFVSVMNMLLIYLFASVKLEKGQKLFGSSFKIMLPL
jgi:hypothetical protein